MNQINVLIIDDSNIVHMLLEKVISLHKDINIIGNAYDGKEGIDLAKKLYPDVIIMDIGMPKMDGLEAIQEIMHEKPTPIIVFSAVSKNVVDLSFRAIELGAVEIIEKPFSNDLSILKKNMEETLIKSIKTFADFKVIRRVKKSAITSLTDASIKLKDPGEKIKNITKDSKYEVGKKIQKIKFDKPSDNFPIIAIAASTGGPQTIKMLIQELSIKKTNAGIVIIQHMAEGFVKGFCEWLSLSSSIPVLLAEEGDYIKPNYIYIAPGEHHLIFDKNGCFSFLDSPPIQGIRPSADLMFKYIAEVYKERVIAVILTGMGNDGTEGLYKIKESGGYIISQDEESSLIFGMPKSAIEAGVVDKVLNISDMSVFLEKLCKERFKIKNERE